MRTVSTRTASTTADDRRPGCVTSALQDRLAVFTDKEGPSGFYRSFSGNADIRELTCNVYRWYRANARITNVAKLKQLSARVEQAGHEVAGEGRDRPRVPPACDLTPGSRRTRRSPQVQHGGGHRVARPVQPVAAGADQGLVRRQVCVVDISQMRGPQGLALAVILQRIFEHTRGVHQEGRQRPGDRRHREAQSVLDSAKFLLGEGRTQVRSRRS